MTTAPIKDWRVDGLAGLTGLRAKDLPSFEILYLDSLAARVLAGDALGPPASVTAGSPSWRTWPP